MDLSRHSLTSYRKAACNLLFARKPETIIIGTGRCGTTHIGAVLSAAGYPCSHERYFTHSGPVLRHYERSHLARADASWFAVPYLPDPAFKVIHIVRHPFKVIRSFYNIGFFDEEFARHFLPAVRFARRHFAFTGDPLRDCLRWYVEWNARCEAITKRRIAVEQLDLVSQWVGHELRPVSLAKDTNTKLPKVPAPIASEADLREALAAYPEYAQLQEMAARYSYTL